MQFRLSMKICYTVLSNPEGALHVWILMEDRLNISCKNYEHSIKINNFSVFEILTGFTFGSPCKIQCRSVIFILRLHPLPITAKRGKRTLIMNTVSYSRPGYIFCNIIYGMKKKSPSLKTRSLNFWRIYYKFHN